VTAETKAAVTTETKVGIFVLASLAVMAFTLIRLVNAEFRGGGVKYRTYLRYAGGLEAGNDVLFAGIAAGKVMAVRPWTADPTRIEILLELKKGIPVNEKSVAKLGSISLMSDPALMITPGSNASRRLAPGAVIPSEEALSIDNLETEIDTLAKNANSLVVQAQGEFGGISTDARQLLGNLNSITGKPNQKRIETLLEQSNALLTDERPKIDHLADKLLTLTQHADAVMAKMGPVVEHADGAIQNANATVGDLRTKDLADLQSTLKEAQSLLATMQVMLRANDYKLDDTVENLRTATENLNQLTDSLKQRPWSLIRIKQDKDRKVPQ
jgi:ABC-type transporter Mla subunit MlaD